jgi:hypothetical protein
MMGRRWISVSLLHNCALNNINILRNYIFKVSSLLRFFCQTLFSTSIALSTLSKGTSGAASSSASFLSSNLKPLARNRSFVGSVAGSGGIGLESPLGLVRFAELLLPGLLFESGMKVLKLKSALRR